MGQNKVSKSLQELASLVGGRVKGGENILIKGAAKAEDARGGEITFAISKKFLRVAEKSQASAVIVPQEVQHFSKPIIQVANPRLAFAQVLEVFAPPQLECRGIHPSVIIAKGVTIGQGVTVGPSSVIEEHARIEDKAYISGFAYLGRDVVVGEGSFFHPRVTVLDRTCVGKRVIIHSGAIIGSDGFGFVRKKDGTYYKIPQIGRVIIEDDVEIGANVTIDRATTGETRIGKGTKIDNLVHIAHNVTVGQNVAIVALVGISGSCQVGDGVILAGQVGITDHVSIGANAIVGAKSGITKNVSPNTFVWGIPARDHALQKRIVAVIHRLPELAKRVQRLEKLVEEEKNGVSKNH